MSEIFQRNINNIVYVQFRFSWRLKALYISESLVLSKEPNSLWVLNNHVKDKVVNKRSTCEE
jgi:hypothetical protein